MLLMMMLLGHDGHLFPGIAARVASRAAATNRMVDGGGDGIYRHLVPYLIAVFQGVRGPKCVNFHSGSEDAGTMS